MIELKAQHSSPQTSYVLMFDGKKVRKGGDVDLLGFDFLILRIFCENYS
jgi:hypothetical protein